MVSEFLKSVLPRRSKRYVRRMLQFPEKVKYFVSSKGISVDKNAQRILDLKNIHDGKRCFIIGSGPSVRQMDIAPLKNEITFGFNAFYLISQEVGFLPTYYLVEDVFPAEDNRNELNALTGTTKIFAYDLRRFLIQDSQTIFVHFDRYYSDYQSADFPWFSTDALKCVYWGGTVAYMALQLAYYMGIKEVYLIGIDLDYKIPTYATIDKILSRGADNNHFHPEYFGKGKRWHDPKVDRMQKAFEIAASHFESNRRKVFNATRGGKLKNLERVDFDQLFGEKGKL